MPNTLSTPTAAPANAVHTITRLLRLARENGASDLHLDPQVDCVSVRMRRDGALHTIEVLPKDLGPQLVGRCKALADLLVYRQDLPQEGRLAAARAGLDDDRGGDIRVATYPTLHGERVALRFQAHDGAPATMAELGLDEPVLEALQDAFRQPDGVVLLTGPSGSGKTTTLYSCLEHIATHGPEHTIVTVEDPIERRIDGVVQTEVQPAAGLDFARALRSLLRQDPDVLLVGEVRDRETASIALEAGLTGHLVASTVHAGRATEVFARLLEMGVEPFVLTTTVRGVLAQRLLRRTCGDCHGKASANECSDCRGTGYAGRLLVAEWLPMQEGLRKAVLNRRDGIALAEAAAQDNSGLDCLRDAAERLVARGLTTTLEVDRVLGSR